MTAVDFSTFRENVGECCDSVYANHETLFITRKAKNLVLLTEDNFNNLLENAHLLSTKANCDWLMQSKAQLENGEFAARELL